ncbi:nuclear factor 7, brain-like [Sebastes fasciatus]|uniref:nuclear factor 7, brain-like n=1 Tax=Sebastes fasciatus TaxID=394691 RepID=UPI003D9E3D45
MGNTNRAVMNRSHLFITPTDTGSSSERKKKMWGRFCSLTYKFNLSGSSVLNLKEEEEEMSSTWPAPREELFCPVCQDIFKDPVLLRCSHSFCKVCVQTWWRTQQRRECPVCRVSSTKVLPSNRVLKNLCEAFQLEVDSGVYCSLHNERLKLFCRDHQTPICVVCKESNLHRNHCFTPSDEAAQTHRDDLQEYVSSLQEKVKLFSEVKVNCEKTHEEIKKQALDTEMKITEEFEVLQQFLLSEKEVRIAALKEEEEYKREMMKDKIALLTGEVNTLESTINTIEGGMRENDTSFLFKVKALRSAAQRPLPEDPEPVTGALIHVAKYLGNMSFNVWCKMKEIVSYTPVILNPNTTHPELHLSEGLTSVRCGPEQTVAPTPERMEQHRSVMGVEGFVSGSHSWDVEVGDNHVWALGVMAPDAQRMGNVLSGLWMVRFCNGKLTAFSPSCPVSVLKGRLKGRLLRVRVHLDWDRGRLSFLDLDTNTVVHTFTHTFTDRLVPYFNTWSDVPLKILPLNLSVTSTQELEDYEIKTIW